MFWSKKPKKENTYTCTVCKTEFKTAKNLAKNGVGYMHKKHHYITYWNQDEEMIARPIFCNDCYMENIKILKFGNMLSEKSSLLLDDNYYRDHIVQVTYRNRIGQSWRTWTITYPLLRKISNNDIDYEGYIKMDTPSLELYCRTDTNMVILESAKVISRKRQVNL